MTLTEQLEKAQTSTQVQEVLDTIGTTDSSADSINFHAQSTSASVTSGFGGVSDTVSF